MGSVEQSGFESAGQTFENVIVSTPVSKVAILGVLAAADSIGSAEAASEDHELGNTRFAEGMTGMYQKVLNLDENKNVKPPLSYQEKKRIIDRVDVLGAILHGNSDAGPTDTDSIETTDRK